MSSNPHPLSPSPRNDETFHVCAVLRGGGGGEGTPPPLGPLWVGGGARGGRGGRGVGWKTVFSHAPSVSWAPMLVIHPGLRASAGLPTTTTPPPIASGPLATRTHRARNASGTGGSGCPSSRRPRCRFGRRLDGT